MTFPSSGGFYNSAGWGGPAGSITGTADDHGGSGVSAVAVSVQDTSAGTCADATGAFGHSCPNYVAASGTTSWSFAEAASNLTNGHSYTVTVETTDNLNNTNPSAATASWTYDTAAPTATVTFPAAAYYNAVGWDATGGISGAADDHGGSGLGQVGVAIEDATTGNYYDGTGFASSSIIYQPAGGTSSWNYPLASSKLTNGHSYQVTVETTDNTDTPNTNASAAYGELRLRYCRAGCDADDAGQQQLHQLDDAHVLGLGGQPGCDLGSQRRLGHRHRLYLFGLAGLVQLDQRQLDPDPGGDRVRRLLGGSCFSGVGRERAVHRASVAVRRCRQRRYEQREHVCDRHGRARADGHGAARVREHDHADDFRDGRNPGCGLGA